MSPARDVDPSAPPAQRVVRRVLLLVCLIVLVDVSFFSAIAPLLPTYVAELGLTTTQAGALAAAYALGTLLAALPAGWLAGRCGARPTVLLGLALLAVASIAFGVGDSFAALAAARFVQGVGGAASWTGGLAWLVEVAPRERRGQLIGTVLGAGIAGALGGPVLGALAHAMGPQVVFPAVGAAALGLAVGVALLPSGRRAATSGSLQHALRESRVRAGAWLTTLPALFFGTFGVLVPLRLDALGVGAAGVAAVFLCVAAVEAAASPLVGRLSDRRGRLLPLRTGLAGVLVACLVLPLPIRAVLALAAAAVLAAAVAGMLTTPASALLSDGAEAAGLSQGLAFGLFNLAWAVGQGAGAAGGARLADVLDEAAPFAVIAVLAAASLLALAVRPPGGPVPGPAGTR